ncbi:M56 family metallopeptidase [Neolewinella aurantiaca]|uniref:M56 family metallopeptidase n=1 Tax=Neolewinella aurantiaca TaxID=2602767 RepID=A0A5C7FRK9_9BACT|nr:M56 family metallopeptidase [Neolewinella aurantiaca]TXF88754.1 M56 family metallopeptidase [Neolewinella aurantiaca]
MTPEILEYLLRLTVIWVVLIAYYFLTMRRGSFAAQRFYLLGTLAFGLVVPLLPALGGGLPVAALPSVTYVAEPFFYTEGAAAETVVSNWSWFTVLPWVYLLGVGFFAARMLVQWNALRHWASSGERDRYDGYRVIRHRGITGPFVAFGLIFLPAEMSDADLENTALIHEASHLRARHHYDTLLLTLGSLLLWFHPLFWMLRRLLAAVHEYEADAAVIQRVPVRTYGLQLLKSSLGPAGFPGLFSSPIKNRITMITNKTRTRKLRLLPLFTLCLLLAGLVVACSDLNEDIAVPLVLESPSTEIKVDPLEYTEEPEVIEAEASGAVDFRLNGTLNDERLTLITEYAKNLHPAFTEAAYTEVRYPAAARESGTEGVVRAVVKIPSEGSTKLEALYFPTEKQMQAGPGSLELTIVGHPGKELKGAKRTDLLKAEVRRVIGELQDFSPPLVKGSSSTSLSLVVDFNFILKE